jgi:hypothetical protein
VAEQNLSDSADSEVRPDPAFKLITTEEAKTLGLVVQQSELQFETRTDLILTVPEGIATENTLFDFFRTASVVEFKSENDPLTLEEYIRNQIRTDIWFLQTKAGSYDKILNVLVLARSPTKFFEIAEERGIKFNNSAERKWLWQGRVGFQDVAIVVCRELPLELKYYKWLLFAPAKSNKWKRFIRRLIDEKNIELLTLARKLRPKEVGMLTADEFLEKMLAEFTPKEREAYNKQQAEAGLIYLRFFSRFPEQFEEILNELSEEQRQILLNYLAKKQESN